jgi:hypothetical protein
LHRYKRGRMSLRELERTIRGHVLWWMELIETSRLHSVRFSLASGWPELEVRGLPMDVVDMIVPVRECPEVQVHVPGSVMMAASDNW